MSRDDAMARRKPRYRDSVRYRGHNAISRISEISHIPQYDTARPGLRHVRLVHLINSRVKVGQYGLWWTLDLHTTAVRSLSQRHVRLRGAQPQARGGLVLYTAQPYSPVPVPVPPYDGPVCLLYSPGGCLSHRLVVRSCAGGLSPAEASLRSSAGSVELIVLYDWSARMRNIRGTETGAPRPIGVIR